MNRKRPYTHILKNLLHEQAEEIIPLLLPEFRVEQVLDVDMPTLRTTPVGRPPNDWDEGLAGLAMPGAEVVQVFETEWIEHSGRFERLYRAQETGIDKPSFLLFELQTDREDDKLPRKLLTNYATMLRIAEEQMESEDEDEEELEDEDIEEEEHTGTIGEQAYYVLPYLICAFPNAVPAPIRDEVGGEVTMEFNFLKVALWEEDAREALNTHVRAVYFLLPAMKNADAALLGLAIEELAQRFRGDLRELGRHLTGLSLMLEQSEVMAEEEKVAAREHLKRFRHLVKDGSEDEE